VGDFVQTELRRAVELLAADPETQEAHVRELGSWPLLDELALEFDAVAEAFAATATPNAAASVRALSEKLDEMSGEENSGLWQPQALGGPEWGDVRALATDALAALDS